MKHHWLLKFSYKMLVVQAMRDHSGSVETVGGVK